MRRLLFLFVLLLLGGCMTLEVKDNHFFIPGPAERPAPIPDAEEMRIGDLGGARVTRPDAEVELLYFGGNASRVDDYGAFLVRALAPLRANVTSFDYRGYGRSSGTPTIEAVKGDALAIYDFVRERAGPRPLLVHGVSLGSFIAAYIAANRPVDGLVLEATAPDVRSWATRQIPWYAKPFVRLKIAPALLEASNVDVVRRYTGPLLLITGADDPVTPPVFARQLHAVSASPVKRLVIVPGAGHGDALAFPMAVQEYKVWSAAAPAAAFNPEAPASGRTRVQ
ncbi:MAG TPA: alpha/beta fold hydrolase [Thermoanaerobaculia bacterium]|nr:alpha/beta fold hydrolase [Thermoanaerobaculia bacterium]